MLNRLRNSLAFRLKMARFGILYLRSGSFSVKSLRVAGNRVSPSFPPEEEAVLEHELGKILFEDCYRLGQIPDRVETVLDVGANVGLFSIAARIFPCAVIHAYEPNCSLEPYLSSHCEPLSIQFYLSGVGVNSGRASLVLGENSLHSQLRPASIGDICLTAFNSAIDRLGGRVDVLKLDCEGAEWSLLEDEEPWKKVRHLTMEYHLWAKPNATANNLVKRLDELGFVSLRLEPSANGAWGLLQATRRAR